MRMIAPRTGAEELTLAEDQLEYRPLVVARYQTETGAEVLVSRWQFTPEERAQIAAGEDLYLGVLTAGAPLQPLAPQVGPGAYAI